MARVCAVLAVLAVILSTGHAPAARAEGEGSQGDSWPEARAGYRIVQTLDVASAPGAPRVRVELLEDQRFSPATRREWIHVAMTCFEPPYDPELAALCASIRKEPLRTATLRLVREGAGVLDERIFERERADVAVADLYGPGRLAFSVTVDYSIGWGSYAGPTTFFVEPSGSRLDWLVAHEPVTGKSEEITVSKTLKGAWRTTPHSSGHDILALRCRPDFDRASPDGDLPFKLIYERFHFDGSRWLLTRRTEPGFVEFEEDDPALPEAWFPAAEPSRPPAKR